MAVPPSLLPSHSEKVLGAMKAERTVKRITFNPTVANPGETLYVSVPKLAENEVIVPGSLALLFNINLTGGHANNFLVQNVSRALVDKLTVKFAATIVQCTASYGIYKTFEDLFLSSDERENMLREGIQSDKLNKIRSGAGDKPTSSVNAENALNAVYGTQYRINLDHPILTNHGVFYPQALYNDLVFELTLAAAHEVVRGSTGATLLYKLENIQLEYMVIRSNTLANEAFSTYNSKEFAYDFVMREKVVPINRGSDTHLNLRVNPQRRSLKGILLLFINPYAVGAWDTESYFNPDITKVKVTVNGVPNRVYNEGINGSDMWQELTRHFKPQGSSGGRPNMTLAKYLTASKFGLWIDLRSMADTTMHGNGQRLTRDRSNRLGNGHHKLLHLHRLRLSDEHREQAAAVGSVLGATWLFRNFRTPYYIHMANVHVIARNFLESTDIHQDTQEIKEAFSKANLDPKLVIKSSIGRDFLNRAHTSLERMQEALKLLKIAESFQSDGQRVTTVAILTNAASAMEDLMWTFIQAVEKAQSQYHGNGNQDASHDWITLAYEDCKQMRRACWGEEEQNALFLRWDSFLK